MIAIEILDAFGDNYIYLVEYASGLCFAVDPGDAGPVESVVSQRNVKLTHILATHHHHDHIGGIGALKDKYCCEVIGPDSRRIPGIDTVIADGDDIEIGKMTLRCIATPGHTSTSVCFVMTGPEIKAPVLFSGDTLFVFGCGRPFECDAKTMYDSLQKLAALEDRTHVYPGHDYTAENLQFALTVEPDNDALKQKLSEVQAVIARQNPRKHGPPYTVPSTLAEEKSLNPFLKATNWQEFANLRKQKNYFYVHSYSV